MSGEGTSYPQKRPRVAGLGLEPRTSDNDSEKFPITPSRVIKPVIYFVSTGTPCQQETL